VGPSSHALAHYLFDRSEGHPFFTMALLHDLVEQQLLSQDDQGAWLPPDETTDVPDILRRLLLRRVARLGDAAGRLLTIAAVAGESWPLKIVEQLVAYDEDVLLEALEQALRAELIVVEDDREEIYRFAHGLIKQVLYTALIARRRKHLHKQVAEQIERQDPDSIDALAHHFYEAEAWAKAFQYGSAAGEQAAKSFANNRALGLYQHSLEAAQRAGKEIEARQLLDAYERLGNAYNILDRHQEAEITFSRMRDTAQSLDDLEAEVRALTELALTRMWLYQMDVAEQTAQEALQKGEQIDDPQLLVRIHESLLRVHIYQGHMAKVTFHSKKIQHYAQDLDDPAPLSATIRQQAYTAIWSGQYVEAQALAQQSLALGQKAELPLHISGGTQILSYSQIEAGKYRQAYQNIRSIIDFEESADAYHHQLVRLLNQMGYLYLELGDAAEALNWDRRAVEASRSSQGNSRFEMQRYSLLNLSTDYLHLDKIDEALEAIVQFEAIKEVPFAVRFRYFNRYLLLMAELRLAQKDYTKALEFAREARDLAAQYKNPKNIARSYWLEGRAHLQTDKPREALGHLQEAVKIADEIRHGSLRWKFRLDLAQAQIDAGESPAATIQEARTMMDQTADYLTGSHLQTSFLASPWISRIESLEKRPEPKKPAYPAGLTPREVEVLRLVAGGATNQQVADELHISVRTVNTHMTNIFNKTGCDNRTAAGAFAIQNNLLTT
jgi:DNA-binding CsgD family transcriptional regulator/tetratricopeptide (TPR) repeat protein